MHFATGEAEKPMSAIGRYAGFNATLKDGTVMSISTHGDSGHPEGYKQYEPAPYVPPAARSPSPGPEAAKASPPKKGKKDRTGATPEPPPVRQTTQLAVKFSLLRSL